MKQSILKITTLLFITTFLITGCNSSTDKLEETKESLIEANENLELTTEEFLAEVEKFKEETLAEIQKNENLIFGFEEKMKATGKEVKKAYKIQVEELKQTNEELKERLKVYQAEDKTSWQKFKEEFNSDMKKLGTAFKDLTIDNEK